MLCLCLAVQGWMPCKSKGLGEEKALNIHLVKSCRSTKPSKNVSNSQAQAAHVKDDSSCMLAQVESLEVLQTQQTLMCVCFNGKQSKKMTQQPTLTVLQRYCFHEKHWLFPLSATGLSNRRQRSSDFLFLKCKNLWWKMQN